ncbi:hypothetical protein B0H10DRAFT_1784038 [Mycena sp. CBHHK59/15]|nr:hypothetical protein B0H10DRAFT_1784038 [Mycena sp. CBHHK59/15]
MVQPQSRCTGWWIWTSLCLFISSLPVIQAAGSVNVSVPSTSAQIVYTPFVCNASTVAADPDCKGAWRIYDLAGADIVSTDGPDPEGANIVPQMFISFRASALYLGTSVLSNATANFTVSSPTSSISTSVDTSADLVAIVGLVESQLTTLTITFIPQTGQNVSQLDIGSILMTVTDPTDTTSFLPTMTLPPSISLPTFIPQSTSSSSGSASSTSSPAASSTHSTSHRAQIAEALGLVLGLGALVLIMGTALFYWRQRRRQKAASQNNAWF